MSNSDWVHHFPGRRQLLHRNVEAPDMVTVTRVALDALDVLRSWWEPLAAEAVLVALDSIDPETASLVEAVHPHRLLVRTEIPSGVRIVSVMTDPFTTEDPDLSHRTLETWLRDSERDAAPVDGRGEWEQIMFNAARVCVGPRDWRSGEEELRLEHESGTIAVPIERTASGAWLSGPREPASDQPPLDIHLTTRMGRVTLAITRHYGFLLTAGEFAETCYAASLQQLRAMGWSE
ncbi:MAG: hypothetical protein K8W52_03785 [Deltaproteobacteria bacterium]|nr:hypothetical protein [Deltaproteobacteria bacterium]